MNLPEDLRDALEDDYIFDKLDRSGECWLFTGSLAEGYGQLSWRGQHYFVHRIMWAHYKNNGVLPERIHVHHDEDICGNRACCNPEHLVALSSRDHHARHKKRFCKNGHDTWVCGRNYQNHCRACKRGYG
jgi:HNH endonuclease